MKLTKEQRTELPKWNKTNGGLPLYITGVYNYIKQYIADRCHIMTIKVGIRFI